MHIFIFNVEEFRKVVFYTSCSPCNYETPFVRVDQYETYWDDLENLDTRCAGNIMLQWWSVHFCVVTCKCVTSYGLFFSRDCCLFGQSFALFLLSMFPFGCNVMAKLLCSRILFSRGKQKVYKFGFSLTWPSPLYMPKRASSGSWQNLLLSTKSIPLSSTYFVASLKDIIVMIRPL